MPMPSTVTSSRTSVRTNDLVLTSASLFRRHHRQAHLRVGEECIPIRRRAEVVHVPLVDRARGGCRGGAGPTGQLHPGECRLPPHPPPAPRGRPRRAPPPPPPRAR